MKTAFLPKSLFSLCIFIAIMLALFLSGCSHVSDFEPIKIYFNPQNGEDIISLNVRNIDAAKLPVEPKKTGFIFDGWFYDNHTFNDPFSFNTIKSKKTEDGIDVYAKWIIDVEMKLYNVNFYPNGGVLKEGETFQRIQHGKAADSPVFEREAYIFAGWDKEPINIKDNTNIYAQWELDITLDLIVKARDEIIVKIHPYSDDSYNLAVFPENNTATLLQIYDNDWYIINFFGRSAYIQSKNTILLDRTKHDEPPYDYDGDKAELIEAIIDFGYTLMDTPYSLGAARILTTDGELNSKFTGNSFDCSSFIQYIFFQISGIKLKGDTRKQSVQGTEIDYEDIQRGDLIYMVSQYSVTGGIGHVGIYLGNDMILHTSYGKGGVNVEEYSDRRKKDTRAIIRII